MVFSSFHFFSIIQTFICFIFLAKKILNRRKTEINMTMVGMTDINSQHKRQFQKNTNYLFAKELPKEKEQHKSVILFKNLFFFFSNIFSFWVCFAKRKPKILLFHTLKLKV